jgi:hypothetical protein
MADQPAPNGGIPIQPVPTRIGIAPTDAFGTAMVALEVRTPTGFQVVFLDPDAADKVGKDLRSAARTSRLGLTIPTNGGLIVP